jgi:hypothetical protein
MPSLLSKVTPRDVLVDPFPHVVIRDALAPDIYERLSATFPPFDWMAADQPPERRDPGSNRRFNFEVRHLLHDPRVDPAWRAFAEEHSSPAFYREFLDVFGSHLRRDYPALESAVGALDSLVCGVRRVTSSVEADVLLTARAEVNTPVVAGPTSVRRVHVDLPQKLYFGLFYMRLPGDDTEGGDLELFRYRRERPTSPDFRADDVPETLVERVKVIPYDRNVFFLGLNGPHALHGVSVRASTPSFRRYVYLSAEFNRPWFDDRPSEDHQRSVL